MPQLQLIVKSRKEDPASAGFLRKPGSYGKVRPLKGWQLIHDLKVKCGVGEMAHQEKDEMAHSWNPPKGGRRALAPSGCPLTSTHTWHKAVRAEEVAGRRWRAGDADTACLIFDRFMKVSVMN